ARAHRRPRPAGHAAVRAHRRGAPRGDPEHDARQTGHPDGGLRALREHGRGPERPQPLPGVITRRSLMGIGLATIVAPKPPVPQRDPALLGLLLAVELPQVALYDHAS